MYNPEQKQYILKNSFGVSYHVYFEQGRGLCIRMLSDSRIWSRGYVLDKSAINDFSVILDKNDIFHFVFQTEDGRLMYGHGMHGQIEIQPILASKDTTPWSKHVSLLALENTVLFFYIIKYQKRYLVSMQSIQENILSKPIAIDYVDEPSYLSFLDRHGKCHLIYANYDNSKMQLNHRVLKEDFSIFNPPEKIYSTEYDIRSLSAICSGNNQIHISFEVSTDDSYEIVYKNLSMNKELETLYKSKTSPGYTGLVYNDGVIYFYRVVNESIYFRSSEDNGSSWSDEELYPIGSNVTCFSYITNHSKEDNVSLKVIPGTFSHGYQLVLLNDAKIRTIQERKTSSKQDSVDYSNLKKKVLLLQNLADNMQRELTKLWLTQKNYEKKLEHLSRSYTDLQDRVNYHLIKEYNEEPPHEVTEDEFETTQTGDINSEIV